MSAAAPSREATLARPLQHNPVWADVKPMKQEDGEAQGLPPIVPINYPAHYSDVMDLFRAVVSSGELSPRVLLLSEAVIDCNSANYSAWHLRRQCLEKLDSPLSEELEWVATVALDTPKNYQLWHHRRCLLERLDDRSPECALEELQLTADVLDMDSKNYHAWSHRQWCLPFFSRPSARELLSSESEGGRDYPHAAVFDAELVYLARLLDADVRNNSAWNQRFFVRTRARPQGSAVMQAPASADSVSKLVDMSTDVLHEEIEFTGSKLVLAPHNESPWNYLEGLTRQRHFDATHRRAILELIASLGSEDDEQLEEDASEEVVTARAAALPNRFAQSLLVEMWQQQPETPHAAAAAAAATPTSPASDAANSLPPPRFDLARAACTRLANELDPLRAKYWQYRIAQLDKRTAAK